MFRLFKPNSNIKMLQKKYEKLKFEAHQLSTINRKEGDLKEVEAEEVLKKIEAFYDKENK